jgi:hypothetical protein
VIAVYIFNPSHTMLHTFLVRYDLTGFKKFFNEFFFFISLILLLVSSHTFLPSSITGMPSQHKSMIRQQTVSSLNPNLIYYSIIVHFLSTSNQQKRNGLAQSHTQNESEVISLQKGFVHFFIFSLKKKKKTKVPKITAKLEKQEIRSSQFSTDFSETKLKSNFFIESKDKECETKEERSNLQQKEMESDDNCHYLYKEMRVRFPHRPPESDEPTRTIHAPSDFYRVSCER